MKEVINGREIIIKQKGNLNGFQRTTKKIVDVILEICNNEDLALLFTKLEFYLHDLNSWEQGRTAGFQNDELNNGFRRLHLVIPLLQEFTINRYYQIIMHELTHLWHFEAGSMKKIKDMARKLPTPLGKTRNLLAQFFYKIFSEGIARYIEYFGTGKVVFTNSIEKKLYSKALADAELIKDKWLSVINTLKKTDSKDAIDLYSSQLLSNYFKHSVYSIGHLMVYTIFYVDHNISLMDVLVMGKFKFIKKYEKCSAVLGRKPLVSATSGKGVLDHKIMVEELAGSLNGSMVKKAGLEATEFSSMRNAA